MCKFFSPFYFSNVTTFWAIFFQQTLPWQKDIYCVRHLPSKWSCALTQKVLQEGWDTKLLHLVCCAVNNIYLIPRQIYVKTFSFSQTHSIIIRFFEWRPEFLMFIAMPRKVQNTENKKNKNPIWQKDCGNYFLSWTDDYPILSWNW